MFDNPLILAAWLVASYAIGTLVLAAIGMSIVGPRVVFGLDVVERPLITLIIGVPVLWAVLTCVRDALSDDPDTY
jgi:hypothetical protein